MRSYLKFRGRASLAMILSGVSTLCAVTAPAAQAQTATGWKGTLGNNSWSSNNNWDNNAPGGNTRDLFFGQGWHNAGRAGFTTANNNLVGYSGHKIVFESITGGAQQSFTITGNGFTLFDFGGASPVFPQIVNSSTATQTFNLTSGQTIVFNDTSANNRGEIAANGGDITFATGTNIDLASSTQLQINSVAGKIITFGGAIGSSGNSGNNSFALNGSNVVVFSANNTYAGNTFINAGELRINNAGTNGNSVIRIGNTSGSNNAKLTLNGANTINATINARSGSTGAKTIEANTAAAATATLGGHLALDDNLAINVTNANANVAITQARAGAVDTVTGTDLKGKTLSVGGAGNVTIGTGTTSFGTVYNSTGAGGISKSGTGTLTLNDNNTYSGATVVTAGNLIVNGSNVNSAFTVGNSGGTITGPGTLGGLTVDNGGTVAPGTAVGEMKVGTVSTPNNAELKSGGNYSWDFVNANTGAGTGYDLLNVAGTINVTATSGSKFTVKIIASGIVTGFNNAANATWVIAQSTGLSNFSSDKFLVDTTDFADDNDMAGGMFDVTSGGNQIVLRFTAVPEPGAASLALLAAGAATLRRRRRDVHRPRA